MEPDIMDIESRVDANQRLSSFGAVTGAIMLALQHIAIEAHWPEWLQLSTILVSASGWLIYLWALRQNKRMFATPEGLAFKEQIEGDELLQSLSKEAFVWGFAGMLLMQVVLILTWTMFEPHFLTIPVAATSTIAAGVSAAVLRHQTLWNR